MRVTQIELAEGRHKYTVPLAVPKDQQKNSFSKKASFLNLQNMNAFNMIVVVGIALILSLSAVQAAPSEDSSTLLPTVLPQTNITVTSTAPSTTTEKRICHYRTPCGWAVYTPFTRVVQYFMENACVCPPDKVCQHADDNLSVAAYIYRCGDKPKEQPPRTRPPRPTETTTQAQTTQAPTSPVSTE